VSNESRQPERTLRASDTEREQIVSALRAHHAAGRLQTNELDQRIATALTATRVTELDDQLRDLPKPPHRPKGPPLDDTAPGDDPRAPRRRHGDRPEQRRESGIPLPPVVTASA
jgi:hypothetical protein